MVLSGLYTCVEQQCEVRPDLGHQHDPELLVCTLKLYPKKERSSRKTSLLGEIFKALRHSSNHDG